MSDYCLLLTAYCCLPCACDFATAGYLPQAALARTLRSLNSQTQLTAYCLLPAAYCCLPLLTCSPAQCYRFTLVIDKYFAILCQRTLSD